MIGVHGMVPDVVGIPTTSAPTIIIIDPPSPSAIHSNTVLKFQIVDPDGLLRALPMIKYLNGTYEVIHDGNSFLPPYLGSTISGVAGGFEYHVARQGGWTESPVLVPFAFGLEGAESPGNATMVPYFDQEFATTSRAGAEVFYRLLQLVLAQGGMVPGWSNGSAYSTSSLPASSADLDHANAFVVWQYADGRQHCVQRLDDNKTWRITYSYTGGALGGAPSATQVPTLVNQQTVAGAGTDAVPTGDTLFDVAGAWKGNIILMRDGTVTTWFVFGYDVGAPSSISCALGYDTLLSGTYPTQDLDPFTHYCDLAANSPNGWSISDTNNANSGQLHASIAAGLGGALFARQGDMLYRGAAGIQPVPSGLQPNLASVKDDLLHVPQLVRTSGGLVYWKGMARGRRYVGQTHSTGHLFQVTDAGDWIQVGAYAFPWNNHALAGGPGTTSQARDWAAS